MRIVLIILVLLVSGVSGFSAPSTYYIDYAGGNDASAGTATGTAWKLHPYMQGFAGAYSHVAGDTFVFKGGVTWPATCFSMIIANSGSAGNYDTFKADASWYAGGSWTHPIFDGEHANLTGAQRIVDVVSKSYLWFENLDVRRVKVGNTWKDGLFSGVSPSYVVISNCALHSWTNNGTATPNSVGGVCFSGVNSTTPGVGTIVTHCEINETNSAANMKTGNGVYFIETVKNCKIHDTVTGIIGGHIVISNEVYNLQHSYAGDGPEHGNGIYITGQNFAVHGYSIVSGNLLHDCEDSVQPIYLSPYWGMANNETNRMRIYNNVVWNMENSSGEIGLDTDSGVFQSGNEHSFFEIYGNTLVNTNSRPNMRVSRSGGSIDSVIFINNHTITGNATNVNVDAGLTLSSYNYATNLLQTAAAAASAGYTVGNLYIPTSAASPTVNVGATLGSPFNSDRLGISRPQGSFYDIGAYEYVDSAATTTTHNIGTLRIGP